LICVAEDNVLDLTCVDVVTFDKCFDLSAARSSGPTEESTPPYFPIGVRTLSTMTASSIVLDISSG